MITNSALITSSHVGVCLAKSRVVTILHHAGASKLPDSNQESNTDPSGDELDSFTAPESVTNIGVQTRSLLHTRQEHYPHAGKAIRDVDRFEQETSNLCEDPEGTVHWCPGFQTGGWFHSQ